MTRRGEKEGVQKGDVSKRTLQGRKTHCLRFRAGEKKRKGSAWDMTPGASRGDRCRLSHAERGKKKSFPCRRAWRKGEKKKSPTLHVKNSNIREKRDVKKKRGRREVRPRYRRRGEEKPRSISDKRGCRKDNRSALDEKGKEGSQPLQDIERERREKNYRRTTSKA